MKNEVSKKLSVVFLVLAIGMVVFFTLQAPKASYDLSMSVKDWLAGHGMDIEYGALRTNAHLVEYFILGLALSLFAKNRGYKWWIPFTAGCGMGLLDETVKMFLPGREFGSRDILRDFVGVAVAVLIVTFHKYHFSKTCNVSND